MNFLASFKKPNSESVRERCLQRSTPKDFASRQPDAKLRVLQSTIAVATSLRGVIRAAVILGTLLSVLNSHQLWAQVGNQNPAGASGIFNGQVHTGCSYDPYTGNATRSVTDIVVAGAVGEYPLALVRTANSRAPSTTEVFGWAGGWNHNYNWILEDSERSQTQNFHPSSYTVEFPDGRVETFKQVNWDPSCYRVRASNGGPGSSAGVRERFVQLNTNPNSLYAYLILPDGGVIEFKAQQHSANGRYYYKYHATAIYDPYGLKTQLVSSATPNGLRRHLDWVIEPAGRWLHFIYTGPNNPKIDHVDASDGRTVQYYYMYCNGCRLNLVRYYNNPAWDAHYQYCNSNMGQGLPPLLWTADDPMYAGAMKRIAYDYKPATPRNPDNTVPVYGQILRERYWDGVAGHEASGAIVSTLTVGSPNNNPVYRTETRGDGATRTFVYNGAGYVTWASNFTGNQSTMGYDAYKYLNSFIDFDRNETNYTNDPIIGNVTQVKFPLTQGDTPGQSQRPTINYTYTNGYHLHITQGENGFTTTINRDGVNRIQSVVYPDGGWESFSYNGYGQVLSHRMTTGGMESFTYNWPGSLKDTYRNPDNPSGNPTAQYFYDGLGRVNGVFDALRNPTNFEYNDRGQLTKTTLPPDPFDGNQRNWVTNAYNPDGTLQSRTDELGHITRYEYDDYRRLTSVTPPARGYGDNNGYTTSFTYYVSGFWDDYSHTDSNVAWVRLPSGKYINTTYDDNRRKTSVIVGALTNDSATTSYAYDGAGNVTWVTDPMGHWTNTIYDQRNRPSSINHMGQTTTISYDTAGHKKTITRPNGQVITNVSFDEMNRVLQQNVTQSPEPTATTKYEYYAWGPAGLLHTMKDPRMVATNSSEKYEYFYDLMGRKTWISYPKDSTNTNRSEGFTYDDAGRLETFLNRAHNVQTFTYDALNRTTGFSWDDMPRTPSVSFAYDAASRLTSINNANANITRLYYNDNLLYKETEQILVAGGRSKAVTYTFDADGNRAKTTYPDGYLFDYSYTGRNQLKSVNGWADYDYDANGNLTTRTLNNGTHTDYVYDTLDRVTWVTHSFGRWFNYGYYANSNNRKFIKRWNGQNDNGDVFRYDLADQAMGVRLDVQHPDTTPTPAPSITYDANGNRASFGSDTYTINNNSLNQYNKRNNINASYDYNGNLTTSFNGLIYVHDAQNRLTAAGNMTFKYDGLNRQVSRTVGGATTFNMWDGWDLIEEYESANNGAMTEGYVYGAAGLICAAQVTTGQFNFYFQDGSGSTSHVTDGDGTLKESYRYDLQGTPFIYDASNTQLSASARNVRHLFTGQQWYNEISLYDLRNRFYSPDIGRFLQPDPIGFRGDRTNLYRYCGNNSVTRWDPLGLEVPTRAEPGDGSQPPSVTLERVIVTGDPIISEVFVGFPSFGGPSGSPFRGIGPLEGLGRFTFSFGYHLPSRSHSGNGQHQSSSLSAPPPQNPAPPAAPAPASPASPSAPTAGVFSQWGQMSLTAIARAMAFPVDRTYRDNGQPNPNGVYFTHYGPGTRIGGWDPTNDSGTNRGVGNHENLLNANSLAISPDVVRNYNLTLGGPVFVNGQYLGNYDDTPGRLGTIDVYDYNNAAGTMWGGMLWNPIISTQP